MRRIASAAVVCTAVAVLATSCTSPKVDAGEPPMILAESSDRYPNVTASDWVTYGDHVVIATAMAEKELPLSGTSDEASEGVIDRDVTMQVDEVVWSAEDPRMEVPRGPFQWEAWGWAFQDGEKIPMAGHDQPRVEVGNSYVMVLLWEEEIPDESSPVPARWVSLGADSVIPYENGEMGVGELEGIQRATPLKVPDTDPDYSLEDEMAGERVVELARVLQSTEPGVREDFGPSQ
jgi:hypothetical protein